MSECKKWKRVVLKQANAKWPDRDEMLTGKGRVCRQKNKRVSAVRLKGGVTFFHIRTLSVEEHAIVSHCFRITDATVRQMCQLATVLEQEIR